MPNDKDRARAYDGTVKAIIDHERLKGKDISESQARDKARSIAEKADKDLAYNSNKK